MAAIVEAFGTSHSAMLFSPLENWLAGFDHVDRRAPIQDFEGVERGFDELVACRPPDADARLAEDATAARHAAMQKALDRLAGDLAAARLDALIVVGDDQREIFDDAYRPAIAIYRGETIRNAAAPDSPADDWYVEDQRGRLEAGADVFYPCAADLATHVIDNVTRAGFDIAAVSALPEGKFEGHAFSFVHKRLMGENLIPIVPVFLNTYYAPNQPTPPRCRALGAAIRDAAAAFPTEARVGILASGGLSHFLVNEALDEKIIAAFRAKDMDTLAALPPHLLEGGSSEIRNWICVAEAARDLDLVWLDYVPGYRSRALTGVGLCFAHWR